MGVSTIAGRMTSPKPSRTSLPLRRRGRAPHPNPLPRRERERPPRALAQPRRGFAPSARGFSPARHADLTPLFPLSACGEGEAEGGVRCAPMPRAVCAHAAAVFVPFAPFRVLRDPKAPHPNPLPAGDGTARRALAQPPKGASLRQRGGLAPRGVPTSPPSFPLSARGEGQAEGRGEVCPHAPRGMRACGRDFRAFRALSRPSRSKRPSPWPSPSPEGALLRQRGGSAPRGVPPSPPLVPPLRARRGAGRRPG